MASRCKRPEQTSSKRIVAVRPPHKTVRERFKCDRCPTAISQHIDSDRRKTQQTLDAMTSIDNDSPGRSKNSDTTWKADGVSAETEMPTHPALWCIGSSSMVAEMTMPRAASGCVMRFPPTGHGSVIGNPILSVIKIGTYPRTFLLSAKTSMSTDPYCRSKSPLDQAGDNRPEGVQRSADGPLTAAIATRLGPNETAAAPWRYHRAARTTRCRIEGASET